MAFPQHLTSLSALLTQQSWVDTLVIEPQVAQWVLDTESLTERLSAAVEDFAVHLVQQAPLSLHIAERDALQMDDYTVREVVLHDAGRPLVFARSVIPQSMCQGEFVGLGNQPLGKILFNDDRFKRQPFCLTRIDSASEFAKAWQASTDLFGRRSIFAFEQKQILVAEYFLPGSPIYGDGT